MADPSVGQPEKPAAVYRPLGDNQIRLLELEPGRWCDAIECNLRYASLDESPQYDALSYVWGPAGASDCRRIRVEGVEVDVTANLETALRYLRYETGSAVFWVDSLCINQDDVREKGAQVQKMFDIYSRAAHVLAWTGEAADDSDEALQLMEDFTDFLSLNMHDVLPLLEEGDPEGRSVAAALADLGFDVRHQNWTAYWAFLDRPYWSRVWILQELACRDMDGQSKPCTILCGRAQITKGQFLAAHEALQTLMRAGGSMRGEFDDFQAPMNAHVQRITDRSPRGSRMVQLLSQVSKKPLPLPRLLSIVTQLDATDDRDKLYSLLGLASAEDRAVMTPDYTKTTGQMMAEYVRFFVRRDRTLSFAFSNRKCLCPATPSWTPEIHAQHNAVLGGGVSGLFGHFWAGGRDRDAEVAFVDAPFASRGDVDSLDGSIAQTVMRAKGVVVGTVGDVIGAWNWQVTNNGDPVADRESPVLAWAAALRVFAHDVWTEHGPDAYDIFWRTLVMDTLDLHDRGFLSPAPAELGDQSKYYFELEDLPHDFHPDLPQFSRLELAVYRFVLQWHEAMHGRTFFTTVLATGKPSMGLGAHACQPGDLAVALYGLDRCLILRKRDDGCGQPGYTVVGDAYVHGAMRGELIGAPGVEETVFDLY